MELNYELLKQIMEIDSPTGYCFNVINFIKDYLTSLGYSSTINQKGNLYVTVKGTSSYTKGFITVYQIL